MDSEKEKAKELVYLFAFTNREWDFEDNAKQCALIAVDLHLKELSKMKLIFSDREIHYKYWKEVRQEIEKL